MNRTDRERTGRRRLLGSAAALGTAALSGCLSVDPTASADLSGSRVFADLAVVSGVAFRRASVAVTLHERATTDLHVRGLDVVHRGNAIWSATLRAAETSAVAPFPLGSTSTLAASDSEGRTVETLAVTVGGQTI